MGWPKKYPDFTEDDLKKIEKLAMYGLTQEKIAGVFSMSRRNFQKRIAEIPELKQIMEQGYAKAEAQVAAVAFEKAVSGEHLSMTMFWLKCRARWKETQVHEVRTTSLEDLVNGATEIEEKPLKIVGTDVE